MLDNRSYYVALDLKAAWQPKRAFVPDAAPKNLRDRYRLELSGASGSWNVNRIKVSKHKDKAKELLLERINAFREIGQIQKSTSQARNARRFAAAAKRLGFDVRVKFPDGNNGSVYGRVGNRGTIRFSDHPPPVNHATGEVTGGFSKKLNRRHHAATMSFHRGRNSASVRDLYRFLTK